MSFLSWRWAACGVACLFALPVASQSTGTTSRIGALECNIAGGPGFIITSSKALSCIFKPTRGAARDLCRDHPQIRPRYWCYTEG